MYLLKEDKYESVQDLIDDINRGMDIEFAYQGKKYSIGSGQDGLYYIAAANKTETEKGYATAAELVNDYEIDGRKLRDVVADLKILFH